ncbi:acyltransferase family protein [Algoriphagus halophytocola]|uniref:Acyltransferase family protein n=1 Tax=Algoriphagus halophytocola TaxID=2991499 RepID=A0ABY6MHM4_9BACT|nr:acyltransferase family protein [Algoriphagus sp. TR-M5]UZD23286.1 acyltransferase family protein [Algoriphagus sp. TR-M5]
MTTHRRYDIDWLRVIAIGLLLIYHIAIVFQPWAMFLGFIKSNELMEDLWKPMTILNVWRIPFLFFVSGMGVYFAIQRRNWKQLMKERGRRILIPFLFGMLAIVPLHFLVFQHYYGLPIGYYPHPAHLWFLGNIFIYVTVLLPVFFYLKRAGRVQHYLSQFMSNPIGPLSLSVLFALETIVVQPQVFELYAMTWHGFFLGLLAFFCGFLCVYSGKSFWKTVMEWKWFYLALAMAFYLVRWKVLNLQSPSYLLAIESNCWILAIFGMGYQYLNQPSKVLNYLSEAAYPIYIIHMVVLYAGGLFILPLEIPVFLKFILIVAFTGIGCLGIYELLIRRNSLLRPFFGLKVAPKAKIVMEGEKAGTSGTAVENQKNQESTAFH